MWWVSDMYRSRPTSVGGGGGLNDARPTRAASLDQRAAGRLITCDRPIDRPPGAFGWGGQLEQMEGVRVLERSIDSAKDVTLLILFMSRFGGHKNANNRMKIESPLFQ